MSGSMPATLETLSVLSASSSGGVRERSSDMMPPWRFESRFLAGSSSDSGAKNDAAGGREKAVRRRDVGRHREHGLRVAAQQIPGGGLVDGLLRRLDPVRTVDRLGLVLPQHEAAQGVSHEQHRPLHGSVNLARRLAPQALDIVRVDRAHVEELPHTLAADLQEAHRAFQGRVFRR
eukprot:scaffold7356_cov249-Pinguiococcus_pyrenoidosus.AAC.12